MEYASGVSAIAASLPRLGGSQVTESSGQIRSGLDVEATKGVLSPGLKLRHYEIREVIGQGGFGITYLARDTTLHRDVAIKEYLPTALALREGGETVVPRSTATANDFLSGRERFLDEARTLAKLDHMTSVVRVLDFLEANGTAYMVMALARGETLAVRLQRDGRLDPAAIDRLLLPLLDGLEEVHGAGFLHRDIKPANILVDQRGIPTLIDFGAARAALAGSSVAMTAIFTPGYAAPEQFTSAKQGPWTDIYGLAATVYQAITGKTPPNAFDRILDDVYEPLSRIAGGGWRPGLLDGIDQALSVHAADRPQSVGQWRKVLMATSAGDRTVRLPAGPAEAATVKVAPPTRRPIGRGKAAWIGGSVLALLLVLGGGYLLLAPKSAVEAEKAVADVDKEVTRARAALAAAEAAAKRRDDEERQRQADLEARRKADAEAAERKRQEDEAQRNAAAQTVRDREAAEAARQKAEADAAAKRQADADEAKRRADAEAEAKRQADAEIQRAREAVAAAEAARQKAEDEAARLRADAAKRQAEADALRQQQAEASAAAEKKRLDDEARQKAAAAAAADKKRLDDDARQKAEATAAEKKRLDDEAARWKADADAAKRQADDTDRKAAEAAETALRLGVPDRQRLQVALTAQGFDTRGADGAFGARSREMIAAWQKARGLPSTGFLTAAQQQVLLKEAAAAVTRFDDDEKKKAEEAKRKAEDEAKARAAAPAAPTAPVPAAAAPAPAATPAGRDGLWFGALDCKMSGRVSVQGNVAGGAGSLSGGNRTLRVQIAGDSMTISVSTMAGAAGQTGGPVGGGSGTMSGKLSGRGVYAQGSVGGDACTVSLVGP